MRLASFYVVIFYLSLRIGQHDQHHLLQPSQYDYRVCALGSFVDVRQVPGARQYAYTLDAPSTAVLAQRLPEVAVRGGHLLKVGGGKGFLIFTVDVVEGIQHKSDLRNFLSVRIGKRGF